MPEKTNAAKDTLRIARLIRHEEGSRWRIIARWAMGVFFFSAVTAVILGFG